MKALCEKILQVGSVLGSISEAIVGATRSCLARVGLVLIAWALSATGCAEFPAGFPLGLAFPGLVGSSTGGGGGGTSTGPFTVGGSVTGLQGTGLALNNNGSDSLSIANNGAFTFAASLADGAAYAVTVTTQPTGPFQSCAVANGSGTISAANVSNVAITCTAPTSLADGPVADNPFGDNVPSGQLFVFNGNLYIGPNAAETAIYQMSFDLSSKTSITIDGDGTAGAPFTSFVGLPNASGNNLAGIDYFYSACTGASPATLTGTACTGAGGTETNFVGGFTTAGDYESFWYSTDTGTTRTYTEKSGMEKGGNSFRTSTMRLFKEQLYVSIGEEGGGAPRLTRVCLKVGGCANGDAFLAETALNGKDLMHIGKSGTVANGYGKHVALDTMWEYDNDGNGTNPSQLYLAAGGSAAALPSTAGSSTDGGILRSALGVSTAAAPPAACANGTDCNTKWADVTPTNAKWLAYMSIALPEEASAGNEWSHLLPSNRYTPAIRAIPAMRTARNGDLYLVRNACSSVTVLTDAAFTAARQTCPAGSEIPQVWMLPKGTTAAPKGAGDWVLVAEAGATGRTDMSGNSACTSGVNRCDTENTHITLLEISGNFVYIGYDNATYGLNVWRTDLSAVTSGTAPAQSAFALVGSFGLGDATNHTRLFSSATVRDGTTDYLFLAAGNGTNAVKVYRQDNN